MNEFCRLWKRPDVLRHSRMPSGQWPEFRHEMWIRKEADIEYQRSSLNLSRLHRQFSEAGNQFHWKIVDAVVTQVFECLESGRFAGAAHAGNDDQFRAPPAITRNVLFLVLGLFCDSARR